MQRHFYRTREENKWNKANGQMKSFNNSSKKQSQIDLSAYCVLGIVIGTVDIEITSKYFLYAKEFTSL